jgi:hypothetical protein
MNQTPLDGPDRAAEDGDGSTEAVGSRSRFASFVAGVWRSVQEAFDRVRSTVTGDVSPTGDGEATPSRPIEREVPLTDGAETTRPVVSETEETHPVPVTADDGPRDRPELVARWHDDRLTLSEPDKAGAQISSDTWAEVDP